MLTTLLVVAVAALGILLFYRRTPRGPRLLNEKTAAREARPFTTARDPRFAPLPFEREKHER